MKKQLLILLAFISLSATAQYSIGNTKIILKDRSRASRSILTFIYYPATADSTDAPIINDGTKFPVISFGHGFVMTALAYQWLVQALVPYGYIIGFPSTEEGVPPNHSDFGKDEVFVARALRDYGDSSNSFLFNKTNGYTAVGGHSMGGGATFLGMQNVTDITTFFNFSAAETFITQSAIQTAKNCRQPALVFTGTKDCVAPPATNSLAMYNNLASEYKFFANIHDASHCQFGDPHKTPCETGEAFACQGETYITSQDQKADVFLLLQSWLDFWLKRNCNAITSFYSNAGSHLSDFDTMQSKVIDCSALSTVTVVKHHNAIKADIFPNPSKGMFNLEINDNYSNAMLTLSDLSGRTIDSKMYKNEKSISLDYSYLAKGIYQLQFSSDKGNYIAKIVVE
ncbi:MAG: hypothetical protein JWN78_857 [Bacteroidota bacterium]|nr:hypothetical protein [Bacteroidota bacterium]